MDETENAGKGVRFFRDVVVDVLGTLVPGTIFLATMAVLLHWSLHVILANTGDRNVSHVEQSPLEALVSAQEHVSVGAILLLLMFGYLSGHFFSRQDPKTVDNASFNRISKRWSDDERDKWVCRADPEFPYVRLRNYLESRDLLYLLPLVRWSDEDPAPRSKSYINTLKTRLLWDYPERCNLILKNEAHVRLMSSAWFMCRTLYWVGGMSLVLCAIGAIASPFGLELTDRVFGAISFAVPALLTLLACWYARRKVELALHYQRVREVRHVLDTAYYAYRHQPEAINDLCPAYRGLEFRGAIANEDD